MADVDILREILAEICRATGREPQQFIQLEKGFRKRYGGGRFYIHTERRAKSKGKSPDPRHRRVPHLGID